MNDSEESLTESFEEGEGPAKESQKSCPLLSAGLIAGVGKNRTLPCLGSACAWWNASAGRCAVLGGREV
jgi:hypothetical protein